MHRAINLSLTICLAFAVWGCKKAGTTPDAEEAAAPEPVEEEAANEEAAPAESTEAQPEPAPEPEPVVVARTETPAEPEPVVVQARPEPVMPDRDGSVAMVQQLTAVNPGERSRELIAAGSLSPFDGVRGSVKDLGVRTRRHTGGYSQTQNGNQEAFH